MTRAAQTALQTTTEPVNFQFFVPIAKVDKEKREVTGIVTQEILDKQGDIVDYATAKAFFTNEELWPGNMREMHQPEAVGKKVLVECDDANKTITLTSRVSKGAPNTWEKVLDTTLSFYSLGGSGDRVTEKLSDGKVAKRLFLKQLAEVSYVDNGACPTAKFEIVKSVDGKLVDAEPDEPAESPVAKAADALDAAVAQGQPAAAAVPVAYVAGTIRKLVGAIVVLGTDRVAQKAAILSQATLAGPEAIAELPLAWQPEAVRKGTPEAYDIDRALSAISMLESLVASEYYDIVYSQATGTPDPVKVAQVAALKAAIDAVLQFLISEHEAQFTPDANGNGVVLDGVAEMFVKCLAVVQKAGARHSKNDTQMIQKVHDLSEQLGAACKDMADDDTEKVLAFIARPAVDTILKGAGFLAPATATLTDEPSDAVKKIAADLETTKAALTESQATVAKSAETVAALETRLKLIEDAPAGGGPVRNAHVVEKGLATTATGEGEPTSTESVVKALQELAKDGNETIRAAAALKIAKLQQQTPIALAQR